MLNKYDFETNNREEIDQPSVVVINKDLVSITHASGTDVTEIPEDGELIIQIGNIESYNPTSTPAEPEPEITPQPSGGGNGQGGETPVNPNPDPTPSEHNYAPNTTVYSTAEYTGGNGIKFIITNNTGSEARFTGKVILNISNNPDDWSSIRQVNAHIHGPQSASSWDRNDIIIPAGESYTSLEITTIDAADGGTAVDFTDNTWYLMNLISPTNVYGYPIFLYTREYSRSDGTTGGSQNMYAAAPTQNAKLLRGYTYYLNLYWKNPYASLDPDKTGTDYIILAENETDLISAS